jgi:predicted kinase
MNRIVETTDQYVGKSVIIAGTALPKQLPEPDVEKEALPKTPGTGSEITHPNFVLVMGGMASGKSTLARKIIQEEVPHAILIDLDQFILTSHEYFELLSQNPSCAYEKAYERANHAANKTMASALAKRHDVIREIPLAGTAMEQMLKWLKELGYSNSIRAVDCPVEVAMERANKRANDPNDSIHFHRDLNWRPRPACEPEDFEEVRKLYDEAVARHGV